MNQLVIADYILFVLTIVVCLGIGIYHAVSGGRPKTTSEYLVGGRSMALIPVALSLIVSFESSITLLGMPAEGYVYGSQMFWWALGTMVAHLLAVLIMPPLIYPLKLTSGCEYLELRFKSRAVRVVCTVYGILYNTFFAALVLYGPALALEGVTGISVWTSIFCSAALATLYTSLGGFKAVIWTDVFQAAVLFLGLFVIIIKATVDVGSPRQVWEVASRGGRVNMFNFDLDPRVRHTFWGLSVGSMVTGCALIFNQITIQRISSTRSLPDAKKMLMIVGPAHFIYFTLVLYAGVIAYSYYETKQCDPIKSKQISNPNQILPFIVMDVLSRLPGLAGLFLAALFSASLSSVSSCLSSISALLWADILQPWLGDTSETKATAVVKVTVIVFGIVSSLLAVLVSFLGGTLIQIGIAALSSISAPSSASFFLGCYFPRTNSKGVIIGSVTGMALCFWLSLGAAFNPSFQRATRLPPASTNQCEVLNASTRVDSDMRAFFSLVNGSSTWTHGTTALPGNSSDMGPLEPHGIQHAYTISYLWIGFSGIVTTLVVAHIVSFVTGMNKPGDVDPRYLLAVSDTLLIWLPKRARRFLSSIGPQFKNHKAGQGDLCEADQAFIGQGVERVNCSSAGLISNNRIIDPDTNKLVNEENLKTSDIDV